MRRHWFPKRYADAAARLRVPTGFVLIAAFAYLSAPSPRSLAAGIPVAALGLALRAWAAGHLAKNERLATSGPYAYSRNPLYLGTLTVAAGFAVAGHSVALAALFAAVFLLVYLPVIELEEQHLMKLFPEYQRYAAEVPLLRPRRVGQAVSPHQGRFEWRLYKKNEEYQALLGLLAGAALLTWKTWW